MSDRIDLQPAYVLHTRVYRETSLLIELLTEDEGRLTLVAKGARRPKSAYPGLLQPFIPLSVSYLGRGELKTLTQAEPRGPFVSLTGERLACGLYLNELLVRLLNAHYPVPELFSEYEATLTALGAQTPCLSKLRLFEKQLLSSLGHDLCLHQDAEQAPIDPQAHYLYDLERGPYRVNAHESMGQVFKGDTLLALAAGDLGEERACQESRKLLQLMIHKLLNGREILSRRLLTNFNGGDQ